MRASCRASHPRHPGSLRERKGRAGITAATASTGLTADYASGRRVSAVQVLLVPATYYPKVGGVEEATRQLARELRRRGDGVEILTNRWRDSGASGFVEDIWVSRVGLPLPGAAVGSRSRFVLG